MGLYRFSLALVAPFGVAAAVLLLCAGTARAAAEVDLQLILAIDSSASIDAREFDLQMAGITPSLTRNMAAGRGITVNGLAILDDEPDLDAYYRDEVIGGPGAYGSVMSSNSHSQPLIPQVMVSGDQVVLIRRRQILSDVILSSV